MASVVTLAPIAEQLARSISLGALFPVGAVEQILRDQDQRKPVAGEPELPKNVKPFFGHYCAVVRAAVGLLGAPAFRSLAGFHDRVEEEYMPGGPPQSPVYDSFAMQFVLGSVPQGIQNETPYSVLARLLQRDPSRARLQRMAQSLADARFELYRVKSATSSRAELEPVRGTGALSVWLTGPFLRAGDFGLMRVLPFDDELFIADSPYLLKASERDWLEHLARIVAQQTPAAATSSQKASKLSSKEQARRRQKDKAKAARNEPEKIIERYLQLGLSERYWLDYIMDAYAGERRGIVFLAGVPDRPDLLPHSAEYQGTPEPAVPPEVQARQALLQIAVKEGLLDLTLRELSNLAGNTAAAKPSPNEHGLLAAYATFGLRAKDGTTALSRFERSPAVASGHPEVRSFVDSLKNGWFSVFRVARIYLDRGLDVFDLLRGEKLHISERSATRQLARGDLLLGWICKDRAGTITLEGGLAHVPSLASAPFLSLVEQLKRAMPPLSDEQGWKDSAAQLPIPLIAGIIELRSDPPLPQLVNTSGDPLEIVTGHYRIRDHARVVATLPRQFAENGDGSYGWVDKAGTSLARLELIGNQLRVRVNSRKRLQAAQERLEALLGDAVERSLDAHEDLGQAMRASKGKAKRTRPPAPPLELSPQVAAQLHELVLSKIRATLDEAIPQFKGKTLRQLARNAKTRPDAISWLREQERVLKSNPQLAGLDMRPLWHELSLPSQGIESDPRAT